MQVRLSPCVCLTLGLITTLQLTAPATAEVSLPRLVSDGMVLQRGAPVNIWGRADAGEKVRVEFQGQLYTAETDDGGNWSVTLKSLPVGGPHSMTISGENRIELKDVLVGDVWLASGQSNMEYPINRIVHRFADEIAAVNNPHIRQFRVPQTYDFNTPRTDLEAGQWLPATQENIQDFSAVAYFFAADIQHSENVPIGIINSSLGGSPAEAWVSEETLKKFPEHLKELQRFKDDGLIEQIESSDRRHSDAWHREADHNDRGYKRWHVENLDVGDWSTMAVPGYWADTALGQTNGVVWFRKTITLPETLAGKSALLELGRIVDADETWINGEKVGNTTYLYPRRRYSVPAGLLKAGENTIAIRVTNGGGRGGFVEDKPYALTVAGERLDLRGEWHYKLGATMEPLGSQTFVRWKPAGLYNAMLHPLQQYSVRGALWYQGESNVGRADEYRQLLPALIRDWREGWKQNTGNEELPFLFVQLPNFQEPQDKPVNSGWAEFREAQTSALALPNTAMAVTIDAGEWNDIHPLDKKTVGQRLALVARKLVYRHENIIASGPQLASAAFTGDKAVLRFSNAQGELIAKPCDTGCNHREADSPLFEFAIAGNDGRYFWANTRISGDSVEVWSDQVSQPYSVRYAWADNPAQANLYNRADLPAAPFQVDRPDTGKTSQQKPPNAATGAVQ